jgi:hypothetical protein
MESKAIPCVCLLTFISSCVVVLVSAQINVDMFVGLYLIFLSIIVTAIIVAALRLHRDDPQMGLGLSVLLTLPFAVLFITLSQKALAG